MKTIIVLSLSAVLWFACKQSGPAIQSLNASDFEQKLVQTTDPQLIDVRTPDEFNEAHISGAVNINVNDAGFGQAITKLDKNKPVFVYCKAGKRSMKAASILEKEGFTSVVNLNGGITEWAEQGKTVENPIE